MVKKIKEIIPYEIEQIAATSHHKRIVQQSFRGKFTRKQIEKHAQKVSNELNADGKDWGISVALLYPESWKGGYFTNVGNTVKLYTHHDSDLIDPDPDSYPEFKIYLKKNK